MLEHLGSIGGQRHAGACQYRDQPAADRHPEQHTQRSQPECLEQQLQHDRARPHANRHQHAELGRAFKNRHHESIHNTERDDDHQHREEELHADVLQVNCLFGFRHEVPPVLRDPARTRDAGGTFEAAGNDFAVGNRIRQNDEHVYFICGQFPASTEIFERNLHECPIQCRLTGRERANNLGDCSGDATFFRRPQQHHLVADCEAQIASQHRADKSLSGSRKIATGPLHVRQGRPACLFGEIHTDHLGAETAIRTRRKCKTHGPWRRDRDCGYRGEPRFEPVCVANRVFERGIVSIFRMLNLDMTQTEPGTVVDHDLERTHLHGHAENEHPDRKCDTTCCQPGTPTIAPQIAPGDRGDAVGTTKLGGCRSCFGGDLSHRMLPGYSPRRASTGRRRRIRNAGISAASCVPSNRINGETSSTSVVSAGYNLGGM